MEKIIHALQAKRKTLSTAIDYTTSLKCDRLKNVQRILSSQKYILSIGTLVLFTTGFGKRYVRNT